MEITRLKIKFPSNWQVASLKEFCDKGMIELARGNVISEKDMQEFSGDYPVYSSSIQNEGLFGRYGRYMFDEELITWSIDGGGNFFYRPKHKFSVTNVVGILKLHSKEIHLKFLYYFLRWEHGRLVFDYVQKAHPRVIKELYYIAYPPLPEQKKIVYVLDSIQKAVEVQEKIIEKTKELKKSMMADLFKYGGPSFRKGRKLKKTEIGEIPEDWEVVRLGSVCDLYQPKTISGEEILEKGSFKVYGANGVIGYYTKYNHEESEVLITCRGSTCGSVNISEPKSWITGNAMVVHPKVKSLNKKFLYYLLDKSNLSETISGSGQPQITRASLSPYKIFFPSLPEQHEIAEILQTIDQKIELEEKKKALYEELFKTMLNKLMSGEIDVENINF